VVLPPDQFVTVLRFAAEHNGCVAAPGTWGDIKDLTPWMPGFFIGFALSLVAVTSESNRYCRPFPHFA
jgi:hypothetical protein